MTKVLMFNAKFHSLVHSKESEKTMSKWIQSFLVVFVMLAASGQVVAQEAKQVEEQAEQKKTKLTHADRLLIQVQKICPIMGAELGSMGTPLKTTIDGQTVFVCCKGCLTKKPKPEHWKKMMARFAKAQAKCPVMDKKIDEESEVFVSDGVPVFICCPPCTDKIKEEKEKMMGLVFASYNDFLLKEYSKESEKVQAKVQKICLVTGEDLSGKEKPFKIKAGKQTAFLCCKDCLGGKIKGEYWTTVQNNIAAAQGKCPVTGSKVSSKSPSVVIGGRKVYVCCKKCAKVASENPAITLMDTDQLIKDASKAKEKGAAKK